MGFYLSPQVAVVEKDLSTTIPAVATSITGYVGKFQYGPVGERRLITQERDLVNLFGPPTDSNYDHWYVGYNFLQYAQSLWVVRAAEGASNANVIFNDVTDITSSTIISINNKDEWDVTEYANGSFAYQFIAKYPGTLANDWKLSLVCSACFTTASIFADDSAPKFIEIFDRATISDSEVAIVLLKKRDKNKAHTFEYEDYAVSEKHVVNIVPDSLTLDGDFDYIETWINNRSSQLWCLHNTSMTLSTTLCVQGATFSGGSNGAYNSSAIQDGYDLFSNPEEFDINLILDGANNDDTTQQYIIDNICNVRKDCMAILNCPSSVAVSADKSGIPVALTDDISALGRGTSSYAAYYGNFKYQYDRYNGKYRWLPLCGDVAGIYAQTDYTRDPWFAPAGFNRGAVKNVTKLAFSPNLAQRDHLYKNNVNPIVMFPGLGPVVFGQKTLLMKPSAFDRVDVRRLFIFLEKAISTASKYFLFEKNTDYTRRLLKGMIDPFLREVKGREGLYDYLVVCDESNNTGEVIDRNELICDIYLKPTKSVEFLVLNFIATKTGVSFEELMKK